jgi:hypothetical protein
MFVYLLKSNRVPKFTKVLVKIVRSLAYFIDFLFSELSSLLQIVTSILLLSFFRPIWQDGSSTDYSHFTLACWVLIVIYLFVRGISWAFKNIPLTEKFSHYAFWCYQCMFFVLSCFILLHYITYALIYIAAHNCAVIGNCHF